MKVKVPAIKRKDGSVKKAPSKKYAHDDLHTSGKRGFILSDGTFADRKKAAKVANESGITKNKKKLYSEDVRKATHTKRIKK